MALGGGTFITQNKILPGTYINFISSLKANANLSDRGVVTMPLELNWGKDNEIFEVTASDFQKKCLKIFGYENTSNEMKGMRDLFLNAKTLYVYRLNSGEKATCTYATAKYTGTRGNDLKIVISTNVDDNTKFDLKLYLSSTLLDEQTVSSASELKNNDYVDYITTSELQTTAGISLSGGTNGNVTGESYQNYFDAIESYSYNVMGILSNDEAVKTLAVEFCKRMREDIGAKFQTVLYNKEADYEGVINVVNSVKIESPFSISSIVYFITGLEASCAINKSCLNKIYNGEFEVNANYTQAQLERAIQDGKLILHKVGDEIRVLNDVNSLVTETNDKSEIFKDNQVIRVVDQIANDIATLFNTKYLGNIPNDAAGRTALWTDIVKHHEELQTMRAIEDFSDSDVEILQGETKNSIVINDAITIVNTMAKLYMTVTVN